jgi:hypothetical protein
MSQRQSTHAMPSSRARGAGSEINREKGATDFAWTRLRDHLQSLTSAIQDEIRNYPTPIAGCDQQFNYLLEKRDQLIEQTSRINEAISRGNMRLARTIVRASGHIDEEVKASVVGNGTS